MLTESAVNNNMTFGSWESFCLLVWKMQKTRYFLLCDVLSFDFSGKKDNKNVIVKINFSRVPRHFSGLLSPHSLTS